MALTFPTNPTPGQEHTDGGSTWVWDGISWNLKPAAAGGVTEVTGVAPVVVANGTTTPAVSVTVGTAAGTVAAGNHSHPSVLTSDAPQAVKVAGATGTATTAARADHVHPGAVLLAPVSGAVQTISGNVIVKAPTGSSYALVDTPNAATITGVALQQGGKSRWVIKKTSDAEAGGDTGSSFEIAGVADDGTTVLTPVFAADRKTSAVTIPGVTTVGKLLTDGVEVTAASGGVLVATDGAGKSAGVFLRDSAQTSARNRWNLVKNNDAETGGNAGSSFRINRYSDSGTYLSAPLQINRATGVVTIQTVLATKDGLADAVADAITVSGSTDPETGETVETPMLDVAGAVMSLGRELRAALTAIETLQAEVAALKGA